MPGAALGVAPCNRNSKRVILFCRIHPSVGYLPQQVYNRSEVNKVEFISGYSCISCGRLAVLHLRLF